MNETLHELIDRYLQHELDAEGRAELLKRLEDEPARREVVEHLQWFTMLGRASRQVAERMAGLKDDDHDLVQHALKVPSRQQPVPFWRYAVAVIASAAATVLVLMSVHWPAPNPTPSPASRAAPPHVAMLQLDNANVHVVRQGTTFEAQEDMPLWNGDILEITGGGTSTVQYEDGTRVRLQSGTQATVSERAPRGKHIHLLRGRIAAVVSPQIPPASLEVTALHVKATVLGTRFAVAVNEENAYLGVVEGAVRLVNPTTDDAVTVSTGCVAVTSAEGISRMAPDPDYAPTLCAYWPLDDLGGHVAVDASLNFNDAIVRGATWTEGRLGGGLLFANRGDTLRAREATCGNFATRAFSLSLWIMPNTADRQAALVCKQAAPGHPGYALQLDQRTGTLLFSIDDGNTCASVSAISALKPGNWYHVMAVADRPACRLSLFVNGTSRGTADIASTLNGALDNDVALCVGGSEHPATDDATTFIGLLDDIRLYDAALSPATALELQRKAEAYPEAPAGTTIFIE